MKISRYLKVDESIGLKRLQLARIKRNKSKEGLYLICTAKNHRELFEIIEGQYLTDRYCEAYLVGLAADQETAMEYVVKLVDEMYNLETLDYAMLMMQ